MPRIILSCFCDFGHQTLRDPSKREQYDMVTVLAAPPRNKWFGLFQAESGKSLHYVVILQLLSRGSRGAFGGSSQDPAIRNMILLQNFIDRMLVPSLVNSIRYSLR
jgi:hypothetical protein